MKELSKVSVIKFVGIDLAKRSFHLYAVDGEGRAVLSRKLTRARLSVVVAQLPACTIAMEACGSAHHWAPLFRIFGHEVRLIAPQFVKPYVKPNKNDAAHAEAICDTAQRPGMRVVAIKTLEAAGYPGHPPPARAGGAAAHRADQPDPRPVAGIRH
jgi:transposase